MESVALSSKGQFVLPKASAPVTTGRPALGW